MHPLARAHVHPRTHPTQCLPFPSCPIQQPHPNPSHPIPSHPICPSPPDPISISFSCARGGTRRARVTAHLIRSKQKICRPHDNPLLLVGPQPPRLLASQRHEAAAQFAALVIHRLCTHGHEAGGRTSCRDTTQQLLNQLLSPFTPSLLANGWPPKFQLRPSFTTRTVQSCISSCWTPISIGPRGNLLLLADTVVPSTMGHTMSSSRRAARIRDQLCTRTSLTKSCLPNEPACARRAQHATPD